MSGINRKVTMGAGDQELAVEDVFKVWRFTGLNNQPYPQYVGNIDLQNKGGMVIVKNLDNTSSKGTMIFDTERGANKLLRCDTNNAESTISNSVYDFTSFGFTINVTNLMDSGTGDGDRYSAYIFRKAPKFFDVVTYQGNGGTNSITHALEQKPGMVWIKNLDNSNTDWVVWHKGIHTDTNESDYLSINQSGDDQNLSTNWMTQTTDTIFQVSGTDTKYNQNGLNYVAYFFGDDDSDEGMIRCVRMGRSQLGGGATANFDYYDFGWRPQFVLGKAYKFGDGNRDWIVTDKLRGFNANMNNSGGDNQDTTGHVVYSMNSNTVERIQDGTSLASSPVGEGKLINFGSRDTGLHGNPTLFTHAFGSSSTGWSANPDKYNAVYMIIRNEPQRFPKNKEQIYQNGYISGNYNVWDKPFAAMSNVDSMPTLSAGGLSAGSIPTYNVAYAPTTYYYGSEGGFYTSVPDGWPPDYVIMRDRATASYNSAYVRHIFRHLFAERLTTLPSTDLSWHTTTTASDLISSQWSQSSYRDPDQRSMDHPRGIGFELDLHDLYNAYDQYAFFREVPGVFCVNYYRASGNTGAADKYMIPHKLGAVPEMIWYKAVNYYYDNTYDWYVYHPKLVTDSKIVFVNSNVAYSSSWGTYSSPTTTNYQVGGWDSAGNAPASFYWPSHFQGQDYVSIMWASKAGISKVGHFSHTNGSSTNVDCNFTGNMPRFLTIKRIDGNGHWLTSAKSGQNFWTMNETFSNMVSGTVVNSYSGGFQFDTSQTTGTYIFLAMA